MNSKKIIILIGVMLLVFVLIKVIADQLCSASPTNTVSAAVSDVISNVAPSSQTPSRPDPLSWEPVTRQVMLFLSKACNR
jgi:hypothetical protein